ncbi:hypothetical protein WDU94_004474 [Cyamophila willieti]
MHHYSVYYFKKCSIVSILLSVVSVLSYYLKINSVIRTIMDLLGEIGHSVLHAYLHEESYIETAVDEDFIVKVITITLLVTILSWIYQCISYYYLVRLKTSIEACVLPVYETPSYFYSKFSRFISRSIMSKIMTVLDTEIAKKKKIMDERERLDMSMNSNKVEHNVPNTDSINPAGLKSILVKDRKTSNLRRKSRKNAHDQQTNQPSSQHLLNCDVSLRHAYIIPVPNYKKMKFNKEILHKVSFKK